MAQTKIVSDCNEKNEKAPSDIMKKAEEYLASKRKIFLWGGVDDESAERIVKELLYLDSLSHDDIYFFINSPGGVISSGLAIYDCMNAIQSDVVTVCCGQAASMGAVLLTSGAKGKRVAWPNARIMIHQPWGGAEGKASDIEITAREILRLKEKLNEILAKHSGKKMADVVKDTDRDHFMSAEEAKAWGLIDEVLG